MRDIDEELEICFIRDNSIWIMDMDGSNQRQITSGFNDDMPSWSPDGKRILFERADGGNTIYIINSDRTNLKQLSHTESQYPTWSADGEKIYYYENNGTHSIVTAIPDGTILNKFTITDTTSSLSPSPDGKYVYYCDNSSGTRKICRIDINSGLPSIITTSTSFFTQLSVSPDGRSIAYALDTNPIYIINVMTGTLLNPVNATSPCWTPDGKTIVYTLSNNIFSINIDGSEKKPLTTSSDCSSPCVKWKPK